MVGRIQDGDRTYKLPSSLSSFEIFSLLFFVRTDHERSSLHSDTTFKRFLEKIQISQTTFKIKTYQDVCKPNPFYFSKAHLLGG
jgi:hypothetical protein